MAYSYDRTAAKSLNLQRKSIREIKLQWARDLLTEVSGPAAKLPGRTTVQNVEGGNLPHLIIYGYDRSDLEWKMQVSLMWRSGKLQAEIGFEHPQKGDHGQQYFFEEDTHGTDIIKWLLKSMKGMLG